MRQREGRRRRLLRCIDRFAHAKVLVVGDLILDRYVWGSVQRISPEAPVPVVEVQRESYMPGGAANVVRNISILGARTAVIGMVGKDSLGQHLRALLRAEGTDIAGVVVDPTMATFEKTRVIAGHQHVVRFDRGAAGSRGAQVEEKLVTRCRNAGVQADAVIIEDYGRGVVTQDVVDAVVDVSAHRGKIVTVDPKLGHLLDYSGITALAPNYQEALWLSGLDHRLPPAVADLDPASLPERLSIMGSQLLSRWLMQALLITLHELGMCLFPRERPPLYIPPWQPKAVFDVAGCGDTAIAVFTAALASGADVEEAALLASCAGGIVAGKVGTATATPAELRKALCETELPIP